MLIVFRAYKIVYGGYFLKTSEESLAKLDIESQGTYYSFGMIKLQRTKTKLSYKFNIWPDSYTDPIRK